MREVDAVSVKVTLLKEDNKELLAYLDTNFKDQVSERKMLIEASDKYDINAVELKFVDTGQKLNLSINTLTSNKEVMTSTNILQIEPVLAYLCDYRAKSFVTLNYENRAFIVDSRYADFATAYFGAEVNDIDVAKVSKIVRPHDGTYEATAYTEKTHTKALHSFLKSGDQVAHIFCTISAAQFFTYQHEFEGTTYQLFMRVSGQDCDQLLISTCDAFKTLGIMEEKLKAMNISNHDTKKLFETANNGLNHLI